jgi:hypothetical protein
VKQALGCRDVNNELGGNQKAAVAAKLETVQELGFKGTRTNRENTSVGIPAETGS